MSQPKIELPAAPPRPFVAALPVVNPMPNPAPKPAVKIGGFGEVSASTAGTRAPAQTLAASAGAFDMPGASALPGGTGKSRGVAASGFGDAGGWGTVGSGGRGNGAVASAGFGDRTVAAAPSRASVAATPVLQPVEIVFKPKPVYTDQARTQRLEGEVQLEVLFCAAGTVQVLRVVKGLGMGLDESAREAALRIRFRPATKDGSPIDVRGTVHIAFELS